MTDGTQEVAATGGSTFDGTQLNASRSTEIFSLQTRKRRNGPDRPLDRSRVKAVNVGSDLYLAGYKTIHKFNALLMLREKLPQKLVSGRFIPTVVVPRAKLWGTSFWRQNMSWRIT